MDLKGKSWVGNIYHKFEAICQEVDDFMSKDILKYVESRVPSIGVSAERLYSDVEQVVTPPLKDDIKPETRSLIGKQSDIKDHDTSIPSNMSNFYLEEKQFSAEQGPGDTLKKHDASRCSDVGLVTCSTTTHDADSFQEIESVSLKEDGDTMIWNGSGEGVEEKILKVIIPVTVNPSSENKILSMISDEENPENHDKCNITLATACSSSLLDHEAELLAFEQLGSICYTFSDEAEYFSSVPSIGWLSEGELRLDLDFSLDEDKSLPEPPETSADKGHQHPSPPIDSVTFLACDAAHKQLHTCEMLHSSFSMKDEQIEASNAFHSSELVFSYCSHDDEKAERSVISSRRYTPAKYLNLLDSASANYTPTAESIRNTPIGSNGYNHHISVVQAFSSPSATVINEIKAVDIIPPFSITKFNEYNVSAPMPHGLVSVVSSESQHPQCYKGAPPTLSMSSSESGISGLDIGDLNLETIDLSTIEKCDAFNTNFYGATFYRQKNFGYYKKLLKDAFASRKRLSKEYEHLAILHGDIDMESKHFFEPSYLPPSTTPIHVAGSPSSHNICDSDWEIL